MHFITIFHSIRFHISSFLSAMNTFIFLHFSAAKANPAAIVLNWIIILYYSLHWVLFQIVYTLTIFPGQPAAMTVLSNQLILLFSNCFIDLAHYCLNLLFAITITSYWFTRLSCFSRFAFDRCFPKIFN